MEKKRIVKISLSVRCNQTKYAKYDEWNEISWHFIPRTIDHLSYVVKINFGSLLYTWVHSFLLTLKKRMK